MLKYPVSFVCFYYVLVKYGLIPRYEGRVNAPLSNGNADGDGHAETCQKSETAVSVAVKLTDIIVLHPLFIRMTSMKEVPNQL